MYSRKQRRRSLLLPEVLEDRRLLAVDFNMLKDINDQPFQAGIAPQNITQVGPLVYFAATTISEGLELWKSDGTAVGTTLVKDIAPGPGSSNVTSLVNVAGTLFFVARNDTFGTQIWKSDGTPEGTVMVSSQTTFPSLLTSANGLLYFETNNSLWVSDGTSAGTKSVYVPPSGQSIEEIANIAGTLYFAVRQTNFGAMDLWRFDGSTTTLISDFNRPIYDLTNVSGTLFFSSSGRELWKFDAGAPSQTLVRDLSTTFGYLEQLTNVNGTLYFSSPDSNNADLAKSDGTTAGTTLVASGRFTYSESLVNVAGKLFFTAKNAANGRELWTTDGTDAGTVLVKDIRPGASDSAISDMFAVGNTLYFRANDGTNGVELWKSDGTQAGTVLVKDIRAGSLGSSTGGMQAIGSKLILAANPGSSSSELWVSDGTTAGTVAITNVSQGTSTTVDELISTINGIMFEASTTDQGLELWTSDGTPDGTRLVSDINPGPSSSSIKYLTQVNGLVYFQANDGVNGLELWKSDGTAAGTILVKDIFGGSGNSAPGNLVNVNGTLYFTANDNVNGVELWKSDGTPGGTVLVKDLRAGATSSSPTSLTNHNGVLYFDALNTNIHRQLWRSDGTDAGTVRLQFTTPPADGSNPDFLTTLGGKLYFSDIVTASGMELWVSDGTTAGTTVLKDILPGGGGSHPTNLTVMGDAIYFRANDGTNGYELWKSDGTSAGTVLVKDITPGSASSYLSSFTSVNNLLYFVSRTLSGNQILQTLYKTDGTAAGTVPVKTFLISTLANFNGALYLTGRLTNDVTSIWTSDGTDAGTQPVATPSGQKTPTLGSVRMWQMGEQILFIGRSHAQGDELFLLSTTDMGDAPTNTAFQDNGARHATLGPMLGTLRDGKELDGQTSNLATGDDSSFSDDEDGVITAPTLNPGSSTSLNVRVTGVSSRTKLNAWFDWNHDGDWSDIGEQAIDDVSVVSGINSLPVIVPANAMSGTTFVRLRLADESDLTPLGFAYSGEVEDYAWTVGASGSFQLPDTASNSILIRRSGDNVQIIDTVASATLFSAPLSTTPSLQIIGSTTQRDTVVIDFAVGGFFTLPQGIDVAGMGGPSDSLSIVGSSGVQAVHAPLASRGNQPQFTFSSGSDSIGVRYSEFEEISLNQWPSFVANDLFAIGSNSWTVDSTTAAVLAPLTSIAGGRFQANQISLPANARLTGAGDIVGRFRGETNSEIISTGVLNIGIASQADGFITVGRITSGSQTISLLDSDGAELGPVTSIGTTTVAGIVRSSSGFKVEASDTVTGFGTLDSPNNSSQPLLVQGSIVGSNATQRITLSGHTILTGSLNNVTISGRLSPGNPLGIVNVGRVVYSGAVVFDIGGLTAGSSHDQIVHSGLVTMGGRIEVNLTNGLVPAVGQAFAIMRSSTGFSGGFATGSLPTLPAGMSWQIAFVGDSLLLTVVDLTLILTHSLSELSSTGSTVILQRSSSGDLSSPLTVNLAVSDPTELIVPSSVTIPAGSTLAFFTIQPVDDTLLDGDQTVTITGTASGYTGFVYPVLITDFEQVTVSLATSTIPELGSTTGTVKRLNTDIDQPLTVTLTASPLVTIPATVTIPAGQASTTFPVASVGDTIAGDIPVRIFVNATGYVTGYWDMTILNDEGLSLTVDQSIYFEKQGAGSGRVTRSGTNLNLALTVSLFANDSTEAGVTSTVTIPAGQVSANFSITPRDDLVVDGDQPVKIVAQATGYKDGSVDIIVTDSPLVVVRTTQGSIREDAGLLTGSIYLEAASYPAPVTVSLTSSNPLAASVPVSVIVPANTSTVFFPITILDDSLLDGTQTVTITPAAAGFTPQPWRLDVTDVETLSLALDRSSISENGAPAVGTITRSNTDISQPLVVTLTNSDATEAILPATVTIPAGQSSVTFLVNAADDTLADGVRRVVIGSLHSAYFTSTVELYVIDDEKLSLQLDKTAISEKGGTATGTVTRSGSDLSLPLIVLLRSQDLTEVFLPDSVTIPANQTTATFAIRAVDDHLFDGTQLVTLIAMAAPYPIASRVIDVLDIEPLALSVSPLAIPEKGGQATVTISRSPFDVSGALTVALTGSDTSEATVPATVTIPAGQSSVTFVVSAVDDFVFDGTQIVRITATASGYEDSSAELSVLDVEELGLTIAVGAMSENGGVANATLSRLNTDISQALTVTLASDDTSEATVPASVTIPAGQTSVAFTIVAVDDSLLDGSQRVTITASAALYQNGLSQIDVTDYETLALSLSVGTISENGGSSTATITRNNTDLAQAITVSLASSDTTEATVPATVTIPVGQSSTTFVISGVDDLLLDGTQSVTLSASSPGYVSTERTLDVTDHETLSLAFSATSISENGGSTQTTLTRSNTDIANSLVVQLTSSDTTEATVPATVTIPAGQASVTFQVTAVDDTLLDGTQRIAIRAEAAAYVSALANLDVLDAESLTVTLRDAAISEFGGSTIATVTRGNSDNSSPLIVSIVSSNPAAATVPTVIAIGSGQASASFVVQAVDDQLLDGTQTSIIQATAAGYVSLSASIEVTDYETLALSLSVSAISENGGSATATITRQNTDLGQAITVNLASSDTTEATVPATITIPAGQSSTAFVISAVDDLVLDGTQRVTLSASSPGYVATERTLDVTDYETLTLDLSVAAISEYGGSAQATVTRSNTDVTLPLVVQLTSSDTTEATVPSTVTIPAGQASVTFQVTAVDDTLLDGTQTSIIQAAATGYVSPLASIAVTDNETLALSLSVSTISESGGSALATITRTNSNLGQAIIVSLASSDTTEATVPATVIIPAGQSSATFIISAVDDLLLDGTQRVTLTASSDGYISTEHAIDVTDHETLSLEVLVVVISENGGSTQATLSRGNTDVALPLTVQITSSDITEATVPATVTIPTGQSSTTFLISAVDDLLLDGTQRVNLTAGAVGYVSTARTIDITDYETLSLDLSVSAISEHGGTAQATLTRNNTDIALPLTVQLASSDTTEATVLAIVTIPAGQSSATFVISALDDLLLDGTQRVTVSASSLGYVSAITTIDVTDHETLSLGLSLAAISESGGSAQATLSRSNTDIALPLTVQLSSSDTTEATVPATVTIPAGQSSTTFVVTAVEDLLLDGTQRVTVSANALGYVSTVSTIDVTDRETLSLEFDVASISESGGTAQATLTRSNTDIALPLDVQLTSSDVTEATAPTTVTIPAGQSSTTFVITAVDDRLLDGTQRVTISASSLGYVSTVGTIDVTDHETLTLELPASAISESGSVAQATLTRSNTDMTLPLTVQLSSSDATEATVPAAVTIPAGQSSTTFAISAIDDPLLDGTQRVTISASSLGYVSTERAIDVTDHETLSLELSVSAISESGGTAQATLTRSNTDIALPLDVQLTSSDATEATVPATVTIPAGQSSTTFVISADDDLLLDGTQRVTISASSLGYVSAERAIDVTDHETLSLELSVATISESGGSAQATVTRSNTDMALPLTIQLSSSDTTEATVPATVTIPSGQSSTTFVISAVDDLSLDGAQRVTISASSLGYVSTERAIDVTDHETMSLELSVATISESGGSAQATVTRSNTDIAFPLTVQLSSSDATEATVPATVTIPSGQSSTTFVISSVDDLLLDGTQRVAISASALGYASTERAIDVTDHETLSLELSVATISESGGSAQATVTRSNTDMALPLTVQLSSSDATEATVPAIVTIPVGQSSTTFVISSVDDLLLDGSQRVTLSASSLGYVSTERTIDVTDQETLSLDLSIASISESSGSAQATLTRSNTDIALPLTVELSSNDTTEATVPATVTVPAGQPSTTFVISAVDDSLLDGTQRVTLSASSPGYVSIEHTIDVTDHETLSLELSVLAISENGGSAQVTLTRSNTDMALPLIVQLSSSDTTEATVPATVTIPAGQPSTTFAISAVDDLLLDGTQRVMLSASSSGYVSTERTIDVTDHETLSLELSVLAISENGGTAQAMVSRSNSNTLGSLVVTIASSDVGEATAPSTVTIPAGQASAMFTITAVDDTIIDGLQTVVITVAAGGYDSDDIELSVLDNDPVFPWQNIRNPFDVNDDGFVTAIDALLVINAINTGFVLTPTLPSPFIPVQYLDVRADGQVTPIDALLVINELNKPVQREGESENWEPIDILAIGSDEQRLIRRKTSASSAAR